MRLAPAALLLLAGLLAAADGVVLAIPAKGPAAFTLTCPAGWAAAAGNGGSTTLIPAEKRPHIQVWAVDKRDVDAAVADINVLIAGEVKDFAITQRSETTVAGAKAMLLVGTGTEADDGDPGTAEVTVFSAGGKVWLLLSHGEGTGPALAAKDVAAALKTIAKP